MKKLIRILVMLVLTGLVTSALAEESDPRVFGRINATYMDETDGNDWHSYAKEVSFGVKGVYKLKDIGWLSIPYKLEMEITNAVNETNGSDEIEVKSASIWLKTKNYGKLVIDPRGVSGYQRHLYGPVDIFEIYEANFKGGLFDQRDAGSGVMAYGSPRILGFNFFPAKLNLGENNNDNSADPDAWCVRVIYNNKLGPGKFFAGIGYLSVAEEVTGKDEEYTRKSAGMKYTLNAGHQIGGTLEIINNHPSGKEWETYGIAGRVKLPANFDLGIGYYFQEGDKENYATIGNLRYHLNKQVYCYGEYGHFDKILPKSADILGTYVAFGIRVNFFSKK